MSTSTTGPRQNRSPNEQTKNPPSAPSAGGGFLVNPTRWMNPRRPRAVTNVTAGREHWRQTVPELATSKDLWHHYRVRNGVNILVARRHIDFGRVSSAICRCR